MRGMSTKFGVDSSGRFPFRAWAHGETHRDATDHSARTGVGN